MKFDLNHPLRPDSFPFIADNFQKLFIRSEQCCFAHKLRKPFTQSAKKKKRLSGPFKTS